MIEQRITEIAREHALLMLPRDTLRTRTSLVKRAIRMALSEQYDEVEQRLIAAEAILREHPKLYEQYNARRQRDQGYTGEDAGLHQVNAEAGTTGGKSQTG